MTPNERADFLAWLNRLDLAQLNEVSSHVNSVISHKRGAKLRALSPGSQIVFQDMDNLLAVGTVLKVLRVSVEVETAEGKRQNVRADSVRGLHVGRLEYTPLESAGPLPMEGASAINPFEEEAERAKATLSEEEFKAELEGGFNLDEM